MTSRRSSTLRVVSLIVFILGFVLHMGWVYVSGLSGPLDMWMMFLGASMAFAASYGTAKWIGLGLYILGLMLYTNFLITSISLDFIDIRGIELDENFWMMIIGYIVMVASAR